MGLHYMKSCEKELKKIDHYLLFKVKLIILTAKQAVNYVL